MVWIFGKIQILRSERQRHRAPNLTVWRQVIGTLAKRGIDLPRPRDLSLDKVHLSHKFRNEVIRGLRIDFLG